MVAPWKSFGDYAKIGRVSQGRDSEAFYAPGAPGCAIPASRVRGTGPGDDFPCVLIPKSV